MKIIVEVWKSHTLYRKRNIPGFNAVLNHVKTVQVTNLSDQFTICFNRNEIMGGMMSRNMKAYTN